MGHSHSVPSLTEQSADEGQTSSSAAEEQAISPEQQSPPPADALATAAVDPTAAAAAAPPPRPRRVRSVRRAESLVSYLPSAARTHSAPSHWSWTHEEVFSTPPDAPAVAAHAADATAAAAAVAEATQSLLDDDDDEMFDALDIDALVAAATARSKDNRQQPQQFSITTETTVSVTVIARSAEVAASAAAASAAVSSLAVSSLSAVASSAAAAGSSAAPPSKSLLDDADDAMFEAVDIDALVAAAAAASRHKGPRKLVKVARQDAIDLTDDPPAPDELVSRAEPVAAATGLASPAASSMVDIEDIAALCASTAAASSAAADSSVAVAAAAAADPLPTPLSLRGLAEPLAVTRFCELSWCELQLDFSLRLGKRAPTAAAQAVMDRGSAIHLEYELETTTHVEVHPESNEDVWALRLINMMLGLQELMATGRTRELPVFGCVRTPKPVRGATPHAGCASAPQPRWVWITGIVDEIVRADIFERDQWIKTQAREELVAEEAAEKARLVAEAAALSRKPPLSRTKSEAAGSAFETKRKRSISAVQQVTTGMSEARSPAAASSSSPVLAVRAASSAASVAAASAASAAPAPSAALVDRTASFSQASLNPDDEWQIERQISSELEQSKENTRPQTNAAASSPSSTSSSASAASPKSAASAAGSPMSLASASPVAAPSASSSPTPSSAAAAASAAVAARALRPRAPCPDFPLSDRYLVLDHKTRMANCLPMQSQKAATYLQVSIYKHLLDRWFGPPISSSTTSKSKHKQSSRDEHKHSSDHAAAASASSSDDSALAPPFPLSLFYSHFSLDPHKPLCESLRSHLDSCGLSRDFTLEDLLNFLLSMAKAAPQTDREMKVEYQWQKDKRLIGADSYTFDGAWFRDEMDHCLKYWLGHRAPSAVCLSDGWKCGRCDYQDVCDQRVVKYQRVGKLVVEAPVAAEEAASDATAAAAASAAVDSEGATGSVSKKSKSDSPRAGAGAPIPVTAAS